ncbi:hypothetical protein EJ05DRAFT_475891 [Pseudovirgaria hyperparasitica]|uniref:Methyltransferase type 11 domain-containing protein n=1 Tax=Pseudovirgaria hyperparasitica TaxID=470096 RepID=A0A6A6W9N5_9PEZI|nr:uncharacterized protein EJ05DRAFT_475891 [Pseudovirgaria hyperparasitica]KAF2758586.1 hypothetical protein EJ05DRAFT_475891 [Pseudovirgaria hyperparasitica]
MADLNHDAPTMYSSLDWDHYARWRPPYPQSLKDLIYGYRSEHSGAGWKRIVDVGGGVGISSAIFASDFGTVHLLDPSPLNHQMARKYLGQLVEQQSLQTKLDFTQATAEEGHKFVKDADMLICAETAHFIDPEELVKSAAAILRPAGTLAIYSYWGPIFPDQSRELSDAFCKVITRALGCCLKPGDEEARSRLGSAAARVSAGKSVLDSIPVPEEYFEDIRRVRINPDAERAIEVFRKSFPVDHEPAPSRIGNNDKHFIYQSGCDPEAEGWSFLVDNRWLHNFIATMRPTDVELSDEEQKVIFGEWDMLFANECPSGSTRALWAVNVILATRR